MERSQRKPKEVKTLKMGNGIANGNIKIIVMYLTKLIQLIESFLADSHLVLYP
jgi:hypothetical protein